ncbi:DUF402 domain-containing protein [Corynebacterium poyangense]|uniref:DUF402 domain-containing protein n=1 Tax=Corynebacterium poyangense TaxID=2684405 RepID=A0A7H0SN55_9CORY|nr:DUF402 domain-containing protein [Corynebacterium poyangense]QNQ89980.1 DUF402 domain-containing protein [Corynebacterium poyangense]
MVDVHPIKKEKFRIEDKINIDPKGFQRQVDIYQRTDFGLYMARGADHPQFGYLESWLLPKISLRANIFHFRPETKGTEEQVFYFDIAKIEFDESTWRTKDLYVDIVTYRNKPLDVLDIDELAAATAAGLISPEDSELATEATLTAVEGICRAGDDPMRWLASLGMPLQWAQDVELTPAP